MAKFRKKPVVVEAVQWFPGSQVEGVKDTKKIVGSVVDGFRSVPCGFINTMPGGYQGVESGDWIVTDSDGAKTIYRPDVFAATYEPITEEDPSEGNPSANVMLLELLEPIDPKKVQKLREQIAQIAQIAHRRGELR